MGIALACAGIALALVSLGFAARLTVKYRRSMRDMRLSYAALDAYNRSTLIGLAVAADREAALRRTETPGMDALRRLWPDLVARGGSKGRSES